MTRLCRTKSKVAKWLIYIFASIGCFIVYLALRTLMYEGCRERKSTTHKVLSRQGPIDVNYDKKHDFESEIQKTQIIQREKETAGQVVERNGKKIIRIFQDQSTYDMKTSKKLKRGPSVELKVPSTSDFSWKTLSKDWKLFSSYVDKRSLKSRHGVFEKSLVTMGYERGLATNELLCVVIWENNTRSALKDIALRIMLSEQWKVRLTSFRSYFYRCRLPVPDTPHYVTLISKNSTISKQIDTIPHTSFVPVVDPHSPNLYEFGVCVQTPLFGHAYKQIIVDSIEMNRLLGAQWFTVYVHDAHQVALEILKSYSDQGILEAVYNWGENIASPIYMKGVIVGINDCLYRNMFKVRYLVFCDFDEVIVPVKQFLDWHDLISAIEYKNRAFFTFYHVAFHRNITLTEDIACPANADKKYHVPQFLAARNRSVGVFPRGLQAKSVSKPSHCLYVHVHSPGELERGYRQFFVSPKMALLEHFRNQDDPRYKKYNSTIDNSMERYKWALLTAVKKIICGKSKHD